MSTTTMSNTTTTPIEQKPSMIDTMSKHFDTGIKATSGFFSSLMGNNKKKTDTNLPPTDYGLTGGRSIHRRKSRKGGNPKKGMKSKTRKGRKDFVTHKGNKYYNRKGHRQNRNTKGKRKSPYKNIKY